MSHSVDLLNIAEVSSKELNETSENGVVSEPAESKNEEITLARVQNMLPLLQIVITLIMIFD